MVREPPYVNFPNVSFPIMPVVRTLDYGEISGPYLGLKSVMDVYRSLKTAKVRGKEEDIVDEQSSVKIRKKEFNDAKNEYKIIKYPDDLNNVDSSVRIYIEDLRKRYEEEKNYFSQVLADFSSQLFDLNYSIFVGAIEYRTGVSSKNAVFYDAPTILSDNTVDLTNAKGIPINWPTYHKNYTSDFLDLLGKINDFYVFADRDRVIKNNGGIAMVCCRFGMVNTAAIDSVLPLSKLSEGKVGVITGRLE